MPAKIQLSYELPKGNYEFLILERYCGKFIFLFACRIPKNDVILQS